MAEQPSFRTSRLQLRPLVVSDAPRVEELVSDPDVALTTANIPHPYPPGGAVTWIEQHRPGPDHGGEIVWAITHPQLGLVGAMGLRVDPQQYRAELGYWIGKQYWGQGFATEAGAALLRYGFETLGLNRIFAHHMRRNPASGRVMQKLRMRYEGSLRQHFRRNDRFEDLECYGILKEEYSPEAVK
jgi:ribosomal-protein-alanine N-acetyltransferase